jgi:hypothetical protein
VQKWTRGNLYWDLQNFLRLVLADSKAPGTLSWSRAQEQKLPLLSARLADNGLHSKPDE